MKIAFINQPWNRIALPIQSGSIAIWTYEVARRLAPSFEVIVYGRRGEGDKETDRDKGVEYRRIPISQDLFLQRVARRLPVGVLKMPLRFDRAPYFMGYAVRVAMDLRKRKCDIVHVHNYSQFAPIIRRFNPGTRIVLHMHCEWLTQIDRRLIAGRLTAVDRVVGCSDYLTNTIRRGFPEFAERCHTVHNGVNVQHFSPADKPPAAPGKGEQTILFVGRVSPEKGVHVLLEAFRRVLEDRPNTRLEIVGPLGAAPADFIVGSTDDPRVKELDPLYRGDYVDSLRKALPDGMADKVSFVGSIPYFELLDRYRAADVFVFPSVWNEPFGLPVVEAMACGVPVVATRSGGIVEIVKDGETGYLVERGNAAELAGAIMKLLRDDARRLAMGKAARQRAVEMFTWERVAEELSHVYAGILGDGE